MEDKDKELGLLGHFIEFKVLILDESTSSVDYEQKKILQSIYKLKGDLTIIIVAHRLNTLLNCDKVFEISEVLN